MPPISDARRVTLQTLLRLVRSEQRRRTMLLQRYDWTLHARPTQLPPPGDWKIWLILAGRGFGKTRAGAETIRRWVQSGQCQRIALIAQTIDEARSVMVEGNSGLLSVSAPWEGAVYEAQKKHVIWPNGTLATLYGAEHPEQLRGPQFDGAWIDEFAKFPDPEAILTQLFLSLRLGRHPRALITTTPRPIPALRALLTRQDTVVTRGSTFENADNLSQSFLDLARRQFEGMPLGDQELYGEMIEPPGTLWTSALIEERRLSQTPSLVRIVIGVDPALSHNAHSDETGIVVTGQDAQGSAYILADHSMQAPPEEWMRRVGEIYQAFSAHQVVLETNAGGDLLPALFKRFAPGISLKLVRAQKSKWTRAEPIALLYRQRKVFHVGTFPELERQMLTYTPHTAQSPDRMDALVWALSILCFEPYSVASVWSF